MRLTKPESRHRWLEIRSLWNDWDPIGVASASLVDEYEGYLGESLRLLECQASEQEIVAYLSYVVGDYMGLGLSGISHSEPSLFAQKLIAWYEVSWSGSSV